jgi:CRISPR system Cascade subunit CasB
MNKQPEEGGGLITYLEQLVGRGDRGALAALRRGLGKPAGTAAEMHPYVAPFTGGCRSRWEEDVHYIVAALFAEWHQGAAATVREAPRDLGASFRRLAEETGSDSVEKRFVALLNCDREELPAHLRHAVSLLRSKGIALDWERLRQDMRSWDHPDRFVQRQWARTFWGRPAAPARD